MVTTRVSPVVRIDGLNKLLRVMRDLPREASAELRDLSTEIAQRQVEALKRTALASPDRRVRQLAATIRTRRDRLPVIAIGGATRLAVRGNPRAGDVVYGTEFGAMPDGPNGWRFPAATAVGEWLYPTLRARHGQVVQEWSAALDYVAEKWSS